MLLRSFLIMAVLLSTAALYDATRVKGLSATDGTCQKIYCLPGLEARAR